jgi:uncharacterized protein (DUF2461 family)
MSFAGFPAAAFDFYAGLGADNSRSYRAAHRDVYEGSVRAPLTALLGDLAGEFGGGEPGRAGINLGPAATVPAETTGREH